MLPAMKIALGADEDTHLVGAVRSWLEAQGHEVVRYGAAAGVSEPWGKTALDLAGEVAAARFDFGVVCCWTGTGVSIAANKVPGIRAALCADAETARGARKWNDANVLCLSLRATSEQVAKEILSAWLAEPYAGTEDASLAAIRARER